MQSLGGYSCPLDARGEPVLSPDASALVAKLLRLDPRERSTCAVAVPACSPRGSLLGTDARVILVTSWFLGVDWRRARLACSRRGGRSEEARESARDERRARRRDGGAMRGGVGGGGRVARCSGMHTAPVRKVFTTICQGRVRAALGT